MRPFHSVALVLAVLATAGSASAGGIELEARAGSLTQNFREYRFADKRVVDWASFITADVSLRYWMPYFYIGASAGYGGSVADSFVSTASTGRSVDDFVRLYTAAIEVGSHFQKGAWSFRPGRSLGLHHAVVATSEGACTTRGSGGEIFPCDETSAAGGYFVQPGISFDRMVSEHTYLGGRLALDIPVAGPVIAFVVGFRTPGN